MLKPMLMAIIQMIPEEKLFNEAAAEPTELAKKYIRAGANLAVRVTEETDVLEDLDIDNLLLERFAQLASYAGAAILQAQADYTATKEDPPKEPAP